MEIIYNGREVKKILSESIPGYKPVLGGNASSENEKINKKSNKDSMKKVEMTKPKEESKPVAYNGNQSTDLGNNKNMLDLQFDVDPGKEWKDNVKKQVTGEDSTSGNKPDEDDALTTNKGNKDFYDASQKAIKAVVKNRQDLENSGLSGKYLPVDKKNTSFKENIKKLNYKNTKFLSEKHVLSLIPEDYKKDGNKFIMRDKTGEEYIIEWKIDSKTRISEAVIVGKENKTKLEEEFNRIKELYGYNSKDHFGSLTNRERKLESDQVSKNINIVREVSDK